MNLLTISILALLTLFASPNADEITSANQKNRTGLKSGSLVLLIKGSVDTDIVFGIKVTSINDTAINYIKFNPQDMYSDRKRNYRGGEKRPYWMRKPVKVSQEKTIDSSSTYDTSILSKYNCTMSVDSFIVLMQSGKVLKTEMSKLNWIEAMSDKNFTSILQNYKSGQIVRMSSKKDSIYEEWKIIRGNKFGIYVMRSPQLILKDFFGSKSSDSLYTAYRNAVMNSIKLIDFDLLLHSEFKIELAKKKTESVFGWEMFAAKEWQNISGFNPIEYSNTISKAPFMEM